MPDGVCRTRTACFRRPRSPPALSTVAEIARGSEVCALDQCLDTYLGWLDSLEVLYLTLRRMTTRILSPPTTGHPHVWTLLRPASGMNESRGLKFEESSFIFCGESGSV